MDVKATCQLRANLLAALSQLDGADGVAETPTPPCAKGSQEELIREVETLRKMVADLASVVEQQSKDIAELVVWRKKSTAVTSELTTAVNEVRNQRKHESHFQAILQKKFSAEHKHIVGVGVTDITTDDAHIEIKRWKHYDEVSGQLAKYQRALARPRRCVYFFGRMPNSKRLNEIFELMAEANIEVSWFDSEDDSIHHLKSLTPEDKSLESRIGEFVRDHMTKDRHGVIEDWSILKTALYDFDASLKQTKVPDIRKALKGHGVVVEDTYCNGSKFRGVKGWSLVNLLT